MIKKDKDNTNYEIDGELTANFAIEKNAEYQERIAKLERQLEEKENYEKMIRCFDCVLFYNGYSDFFRDMYTLYHKQREEEKEEWYSFSIWNYIDRENFCEEALAQIQVLWMMLVEMFGECGTSPRYGWITDGKGFEGFMSELLNRLSD